MCFNEEIKEAQLWNGKSYLFDADASPEAWKYYKEAYSEEFWMEMYDIEVPTFFNRQKDENNRAIGYNFQPYNDHKSYERLVALEKRKSPIEPSKNINGNEYYNPVSRLSGETDFNFKSEKEKWKSKYDIYKEKLKDDFSGQELEDYLIKLNQCKEMHHSKFNFSLMQVMGNAQGYKSKGIQVNKKFEWLDRVDSYIYLLDLYYKKNYNDRLNDKIIENAGKWNSGVLSSFLNKFCCIYHYCKKIYFIDDKLVDKMIESGSKPIDSGIRAVEYMDIAFEFWEQKKKHYRNVCDNRSHLLQ